MYICQRALYVARDIITKSIRPKLMITWVFMGLSHLKNLHYFQKTIIPILLGNFLIDAANF